MTIKKQTKRQIQAQQTKDYVYNIAIHLFESKGFENITVSEICKQANVSTGTFYNVFKSKYEILNRIFELADIYFTDIVQPEIINLPYQEAILKYFDYYADYTLDRGFSFTQQLYNVKNNLFAKDNRIMLIILKDVIENAKNKNELNSDLSSDEILQFLFVCIRGLVYDWCLREGKFDLKSRIHDYVKRLITTL